MLRSRSNLLLGSSVAIFVAALIGVQLGHGAIAGIDPVFFQGAPPPPRAVDGTIRQPRPPEYLEAYDWQQGQEARMGDCGVYCDSPSAYETYAFAQSEPVVQLAGQNWRETTAPAQLEPWPAGQVAVHRGGDVTRYTDYPIEEKPDVALISASDEVAKSEPDEPAEPMPVGE